MMSERSSHLSSGVRIYLLLGNMLPLLHCGLCIALLVCESWTLSNRIAAALAALYLLPPLLARIVLCIVPISVEPVTVKSKQFVAWWMLAQLQGVFLRFPQLDEALRLLPGAYSLWLRMWGSKIGRLTMWAPGVVILDRSFLHLGDDVVFGAGVRINPHVFRRRPDGEFELLLAPVTVGARAVVGGYSLLTAGTVIGPSEVTTAHLLLPPFSRYVNGKREKPSGAAA